LSRCPCACSPRRSRRSCASLLDEERPAVDRLRQGAQDTGERVDPDDIVRGFEAEKGHYVELTDEDIDRLDIELTNSIDICDFADIDEIDPIYFRKAYYLQPDKGAEKPCRLLLAASRRRARLRSPRSSSATSSISPACDR
jgi:DNA end-binding protein Ku